ncbi:MAG TPA: HD domain-containing phosphohydrolase, partial [Rhodocyclaceae bacterium]|nr:HD domain-containing phosphohydrolase [Rhodocyclaceae bacterium]
RGTRVSAQMYERVVNHKLLKPIETSLSASNLPDLGAGMVQEGQRLMDELPLLRKICNWSHGRVTPLGMLKEMNFTSQALTLLAVVNAQSEESCRHYVLVSLLAMGMANAYRYNDPKLLVSVGLGGIFHDVGELYIDPAFVRSEHTLAPKEWMSYSAHPIIGAALAREIAGFDTAVQRGILEHHERLDGFGYPRCLQGQSISPAGRLLALAEMLAAIVLRPSAMRRVDIALKIMPGEYEPGIVNVLADLVGECAKENKETPEAVSADVTDKVHQVFLRTATVLNIHDEISPRVQSFSALARTAITESFQRFVRVQRAFTSTGIMGLADIGAQLSQQELVESRFEAFCVLNEVSWRLSNISRELTLKCLSLPDEESSVLMQLAQALAGDAA